MIFIGKNITSMGDILHPVSVENVYRGLINPKGEVAKLQDKLQQILLIDSRQYRKMKTALPYIVCGNFHPRIRKKENFVFTERFFLDIDHLSQIDLDIKNVKAKLEKDERIELLFTSPGGDGLKLLFKLNEKITDSGYYASFYKAFCKAFALQHNLGIAIDNTTHDVSRCCFVSYDPEAYYNPKAGSVSAVDFLSPDFFEITDLKNKPEKKTETGKGSEIESTYHNKQPESELPDHILNKIKVLVGQRVRTPKEKIYIQPEGLQEIITEIVRILSEIEITIVSSKPIDYGRQLRVAASKYWAEINIFFGQKGVSVVGTTKSGSNKELRDAVVTLLKDYFHGKA